MHIPQEAWQPVPWGVHVSWAAPCDLRREIYLTQTLALAPYARKTAHGTLRRPWHSPLYSACYCP